MVPLETPARAAMSSSRALASPFWPKTSSAASMIWAGRASGRRFQRGVRAFLTELVDIRLYITDWSVRVYYPRLSVKGTVQGQRKRARPLVAAQEAKGVP